MSAKPATVYAPVDPGPNLTRNGHYDVRARTEDDRRGARARYFGPHRSLFGIFDEPEPASDRGVVLCYPHGTDYDTAFRSFRILGTRLTRAGFHVLRFDYLGTGDSSGDIEDTSISQWAKDTIVAIHELRDSCNLRHLAVVGLRLGATIATLAAADSEAVDQLVAWEPVIDGREYVAALQALHQTWIKDEVRNGRGKSVADDDLFGCRLTPTMRSDLQNLSLLTLPKGPAGRVNLVSNQSSAEVVSLSASLRARGVSVDADVIEAPTIWSRTPSMPEVSVPNRSLQKIVDCVSEAAR